MGGRKHKGGGAAAVVSMEDIAASAEAQVRVIQAERARVWEDDLLVLHLTIDGEDFDDVRAIRLFPISSKEHYVSFVDRDEREMAMLTDPGNLDKDSRKTLRKALARMYYVATITEVFSITEKMGVGYWRVMTDRGYAEFEIINREHIRELPPDRYIIVDADGNRFEISSASGLDPRSYGLILSET